MELMISANYIITEKMGPKTNIKSRIKFFLLYFGSSKNVLFLIFVVGLIFSVTIKILLKKGHEQGIMET